MRDNSFAFIVLHTNIVRDKWGAIAYGIDPSITVNLVNFMDNS